MGTIATIQGPFAWGPRPGQPTNVMDCPEYDVVPDANDRAMMREAMAARGFGRWLIGPIYGHAYDGNYPDTDWTQNPAGFLARADELIHAGFDVEFHAIPDTVPGVHEDGTPNFEWLNRVLKPIYQSPEFQTRFKKVTIAWEPDWDSATWEAAATWTRECFPLARILVHMQPGHSGPGKGYEEEGFCWRRVAPYVNGCAFQSGQFGEPDYKWMETDGVKFQSKMTRVQQFMREVWDICRRFATGLNDWPTTGHNGEPLICEAREYASYWVYHGSATEAEANEFGYAVNHAPAFENPDRPGEIVDLAPYRPIVVGDGWRAAA